MKKLTAFKEFYKRNLPHIHPNGAVFFVTYRLDFSYPTKFLEKQNERIDYYTQKLANIKNTEEKEIETLLCAKYLFDYEETFLNTYKSPKWLEEKDIADVVADSLLWGNSKRYDLISYCIMQNHVHILIKPISISENKSYPLSKIMFDHKRFTANKANSILQRKGHFWFGESYDHVVRDEKEYSNIIKYILYNPVKAHLVGKPEEWKYSFSKYL